MHAHNVAVPSSQTRSHAATSGETFRAARGIAMVLQRLLHLLLLSTDIVMQLLDAAEVFFLGLFVLCEWFWKVGWSFLD